ncbi:cellulose synthase-like protein H1-like protein [Corchorus capsularis]|uniref:Cellulose synthase-like protein H1-like protein n=1 Tax=Corchorus capsularis TaxID=210143 RepID=A0A1R3JD52_COCAP|nr:cellulose synthase-like protein H1-like protein [Corchorus capsularis]
MAKSKPPTQLPLCERVSSKSIIRRTVDVTVFCLFLCLLSYRLHSLRNHGFTWLPLLAFLCESCFASTWFLNLSTRWNPVEHKTYTENLLSRVNELPPVDMFVTTADPLLEPPLVTVNTVLSLLAVNYPPEKLACYVSDDGCSPVIFYTLVEASKFAQLWVPFCKKYNVQVRAPFRYFSAAKLPPPDDHNLSGFEQEWIKMKDEYEQLCGKIENTAHDLMLGPHSSSEYADFKNIDRNNHPSIVKVIWENKKDQSTSLPHLVYISREKRPNYPHHYKAGAMNVLTRVSGVMTNAPFMLNVEYCDMFANNPKIILHGVCLLVGIKDEQDCAFVQCLQIFYNVLKDDPFGNQVTIPVAIFGGGMAGIQGPSYSGTGCFHRRKTIYGIPPNHDDHINGTDRRIMKERFGKSTKFRESVVKILNGSGEKEEHFPCDISRTIESACRVADCNYENSTCWGIELHFRQALAYLYMLTWALRSIPEFVYVILPSYCIITNSHILPKVQEPVVYIPVSLFLIYNLNSLSQYLKYGQTIRAWWNAQRMARIIAVSSLLFATLSMIVKLFGYSETVFEITQKTQSDDDQENDVDKVAGRFTFDESPMSVSVTALLMLHLTALAIWLLGVQPPPARGGDGGSGVGEILCSVYRLNSLNNHGFIWLLAFLCELWFTFDWLLKLITRWNPIEHKTYPENLFPSRLVELPPVDIFVTTADPLVEPPLVTINTVLSLLALDYPPEKLACYVSDDGCSALNFYSPVEVSKFAQLWVPFCKKYNVQVRAPFQYFSPKALPPHDVNSPGFKLEWQRMKDEYEQLCGKIEDATQNPKLGSRSPEYSVFLNIKRNNHPSIVKVIWENKKDQTSSVPHLVYISREKRPNHPHHYKAGAMNVLTRVSGLMTNAPFILNVDCDMFASDPKVIQHGICSLLGVDDEQACGFTQFSFAFSNDLEDDPFGNKLLLTLIEIFGGGMAGIQGPTYNGTGCIHRRKIIYGLPPSSVQNVEGKTPQDYQKLEERFGNSREFCKSVASILFGSEGQSFPCNIASTIDYSASKVADCDYENNTSWGREVGLAYGTVTEDIITGLRTHKLGWKSTFVRLNPPAFMGYAAQGALDFMTQMKRWGTGHSEIFFSKHGPMFLFFTSKLHFRQALAYFSFTLWGFSSIPDVCYMLLSAYCIITNTSFLPKVEEPIVYVPVFIFVINKLEFLALYLLLGKSLRAWWNGHRTERIATSSSMLLAFLTMLLKNLGLSETVFDITQKTQTTFDDDHKVGRFVFDESPIFMPGTSLLLVHLIALAMWVFGLQPPAATDGVGSGLGEILCSVWVVLNFWPFLKGLFGKGQYGIPWSTIWKSAALVLLFVQLSK